jgi:hypothetical protein
MKRDSERRSRSSKQRTEKGGESKEKRKRRQRRYVLDLNLLKKKVAKYF